LLFFGGEDQISAESLPLSSRHNIFEGKENEIYFAAEPAFCPKQQEGKFPIHDFVNEGGITRLLLPMFYTRARLPRQNNPCRRTFRYLAQETIVLS